jgi:hypothetical protein
VVARRPRLAIVSLPDALNGSTWIAEASAGSAPRKMLDLPAGIGGVRWSGDVIPADRGR